MQAEMLRTPDEVDKGCRFSGLRHDGAPEAWVVIDEVGGWVCAVLDPSRTGGMCGMPVESEPCPTHAPEVTG
jgi:hypothetical protein